NLPLRGRPAHAEGQDERRLRPHRAPGHRRPYDLTSLAMRRYALPLILFLAVPALAAQAPQRPEETPHVTLSRGALTLTVLLPDARNGYYRATRFDGSGLVARASFGGHTFYSPWQKTNGP